MEVLKDSVVINGNKYDTLEIELPKTTFLIIGNSKGFIMCGALDVDIYDSPKLISRGVICAKAIGVKTIDDLIAASVYQASSKAREIGIVEGTKVIEALGLLN